ncbi:hypothetical protein SAMN06296427_102233 [Moheibacter sediminis]|uniref:Uncharacterized protein n=1 Tax=Moheibacter sediminis TaxID=1434700 RepID=A0A1W1Z6D2_9FLAO|nr:hypothetical protein SAMN06296427_102233 [Moheibacter sediminis]
MSYRTFNIIIKTENDESDIKDYLLNNFKFFNVKAFF